MKKTHTLVLTSNIIFEGITGFQKKYIYNGKYDYNKTNSCYLLKCPCSNYIF